MNELKYCFFFSPPIAQTGVSCSFLLLFPSAKDELWLTCYCFCSGLQLYACVLNASFYTLFSHNS